MFKRPLKAQTKEKIKANEIKLCHHRFLLWLITNLEHIGATFNIGVILGHCNTI